MTTKCENNIFSRDYLRLVLLFVLLGNLGSIFYFFSGGDNDNNKSPVRSKRSNSNNFKSGNTDSKLIHVVKESVWDWQEPEFLDGFADCPNYSNCRLKVHTIDADSLPSAVPNYGHAVVFTIQALSLHPNSEFWTQAAAMKSGPNILWAFHSLNNPFDYPLDFLSFRNFNFNFTMTYKPSSDIFTPYDFWQTYDVGGGAGRRNNPKLTIKNHAANKTRKVLWQLEGPCRSVNDRMKYATELSEFISVDVIGHCFDEETGRERQVDLTTHGDVGRRRGVMEDYKFYLAFEEISCRDYVTDVFFDVVATENIVPIVMGAQKSAYELVGPPNSFIHIDDFSGPKDLAKYLRKLDENDRLYNAYFAHAGTGTYGVPVSSMCRICDAVNYYQETGYEQSYTKEEMDDFWTVGDCNTNSISVEDDEDDNEL